MNVSLLLFFLQIAESVYVGSILIITHTAYVVKVSPSLSSPQTRAHTYSHFAHSDPYT